MGLKINEVNQDLSSEQITAGGNPNNTDVAFVKTVTDNASSYTNSDYSRAVAAHKLQDIIGRSSVRDYVDIIKECITAAEDILGGNLGFLKVETTRKATAYIRTKLVPLPPTIMQRYKLIKLAANAMKINGLPFLITTSRHIIFISGEYLTKTKKDIHLSVVRHISRVYVLRGFIV